jgi:hypothetical protein
MRALSMAGLIVALGLLGADANGQPPAAAYSAAGLYNLANSYARAGKPGMAVLNYERAALLAPTDTDIQENLKLVRSSLHLPAPAQGALSRVAHLASPATVAWIGVLGILIAGMGLIVGKMFPARRTFWVASVGLGIAGIGFTVCNAIVLWPKIHEAVVIAATTPIRDTPVPMGDPLLQLSEAETVTITAGHEDFVLVRTASGHSGWVARADLADVVPRAAIH